MRNRVVSIAIAFLALFGAIPAIVAQQEPASSGPPAVGRGAWLIGVLKDLADHADLNDPAIVAQALKVKFKRIGEPRIWTAGGECAPSETYVPSSASNYVPEEPNWFHPTKEGVRYTVEPAGGSLPPPERFKPVERQPDPRLDYISHRKLQCRTGEGVVERQSARISLSEIYAFACITEDDLKRFLPGVQRYPGLDGSVPYSYLGKRDGNAGTMISFEFWSAPCLSTATLESGWRYGFSP